MKTQAILLAHYGAARRPALEKTAFALERAVGAAFPEWEAASCFTGEGVLRILRRQGEQFLSASEALERLLEKGCRRVLVQPTHLTGGAEYQKLCRTVLSFRERFSPLVLGGPLLTNKESLNAVCTFLEKAFPLRPERAVVFAGHGGSDAQAYQGLANGFRETERRDLVIGLLKGEPGLEILRRLFHREGFSEICLVPLFFAAGAHFFRDIAGEAPESWKSRLEGDGFSVRVSFSGMGEYPDIREIYLNRIRQLAGRQIGGLFFADQNGGH